MFRSDIFEPAPEPMQLRRRSQSRLAAQVRCTDRRLMEEHDLPMPRHGSEPVRSLIVVLPDGYEAQPGRRYPVIYLLHGFGHNSSGARFWFGDGYAPGLDVAALSRAAWASDDRAAAILVCPDGRTPEGGNFWEDSFSGGAIRSWLLRDVIDFVDSRYRTIATAGGRLIAGHSMGAQAAMGIAIENPERFASVYGLSGMMTFCRAELLGYAQHWFNAGMPVVGRGIGPDLDETAGAYYAFVSTFCGSPDRCDFDHPVVRGDGGFAISEAAAERFLARWPQHIAAANPDGLRALRNIGFEVGVGDEYRWGIEANRIFAGSLQFLGVPFVYEEYDGRHADRLADRVATGLLPFASRAFKRDLQA